MSAQLKVPTEQSELDELFESDDCSPLGEVADRRFHDAVEKVRTALPDDHTLTLCRDWEGCVVGMVESSRGRAHFDVLAFSEDGRVGHGGINQPVMKSPEELLAEREELAPDDEPRETGHPPRPVVEIEVGERVQFIRTVERYPFFIIDEGDTGTIRSVENSGASSYVEIRLDRDLGDDCAEWENCLIVTPEDGEIAGANADDPPEFMQFVRAALNDMVMPLPADKPDEPRHEQHDPHIGMNATLRLGDQFVAVTVSEVDDDGKRCEPRIVVEGIGFDIRSLASFKPTDRPERTIVRARKESR